MNVKSICGAGFRNILWAGCLFVLIIGLPGCGATGQTTPAQLTTTVSTSTAPADESTTAASSSPDVTTSAQNQPADPMPFAEADLVITVQGQDFILLEDAAALLLLLGQDYQYSEAESCVYEGMDKTFDYGTICVYTIPAGAADLLDGIDIYDDSLTTARGIAVGAARDQVLQAYGPQAGDESDLVYNMSGDVSRLGDPKLTFLMDNDRVVGISYYSGSNFQD